MATTLAFIAMDSPSLFAQTRAKNPNAGTYEIIIQFFSIIFMIMVGLWALRHFIENEAKKRNEKKNNKIRRMSDNKSEWEPFIKSLFQDIYSNVLIGALTSEKARKLAKFKVSNRSATQSLAAAITMMENLHRAGLGLGLLPGDQALQHAKQKAA
jgi:hypothetical protein